MLFVANVSPSCYTLSLSEIKQPFFCGRSQDSASLCCGRSCTLFKIQGYAQETCWICTRLEGTPETRGFMASFDGQGHLGPASESDFFKVASQFLGRAGTPMITGTQATKAMPSQKGTSPLTKNTCVSRSGTLLMSKPLLILSMPKVEFRGNPSQNFLHYLLAHLKLLLIQQEDGNTSPQYPLNLLLRAKIST